LASGPNIVPKHPNIGVFLKRTYGVSYSRSGLIALPHRQGFAYRKLKACRAVFTTPDSRPSSTNTRTAQHDGQE
jgi:hypothetical protein